MKNRTIFEWWGAVDKAIVITVPNNTHTTPFTAGIINRLSLLDCRKWDGKFCKHSVDLNMGFHLQNEDCYVHTEHTYYWMSVLTCHYQIKAWVEKGSFFLWWAILQYKTKEKIFLLNWLKQKHRELQKQLKLPRKTKSVTDTTGNTFLAY